MNASTTNKPALSSKTILVVDDDPDFLLQAQMHLQAAGYHVLSAGSLREADQLLAQNTPDLVVADLMMEYLDAGFVLCHRVKKKNPQTPVIMVTSVTSETGIDFESSPGRVWIKADAILAKPLRPEQLRQEISRFLFET